MIPNEVKDPRPARKQIADPEYRTRRIESLNEKLASCYFAASLAKTKKEREFRLEMAELYRKRILWYLR